MKTYNDEFRNAMKITADEEYTYALMIPALVLKDMNKIVLPLTMNFKSSI